MYKRQPGTLTEMYHGHSINGLIGERYGVRELRRRAKADRTLLIEFLRDAEEKVAQGLGEVPELGGPTQRPRWKPKSPRKSPRSGKSTRTKRAATRGTA